ncbi:MAG: Bug family tripartite tricarboxylate transporter substrate binding protein [Burkholderiaceae bacterium]
MVNKLLFSLLSLLCPLAVSVANAQSFPSRPISIVVPVSPGGIVDLAGRLAAEALSNSLNQSVVVENRPGASANIGYAHVAQAKPDGYTLLASYSLYHVVNPLIFSKLSWKPESFTPVGRVATTPSVVVVPTSLPVNNLKEFVEYAKKNPGAISFASQGSGSVSHLGSELLKQATGIEMVHVPYKGSGPAMQDLIAGRVQFFVTAPPAVLGHIQQGRLRALAIAGSERHALLPDVPTSVEQGFPAFQLNPWVSVFAPAGTPAAEIRKLSQALEAGLKQPDLVARGKRAGAEIDYQAPDALAKTVQDEGAHWAVVVKAAKITAD